MLRMESANQEIDGRPLPPLGEDARPKYRAGFGKWDLFFVYRMIHTEIQSRFAQKLGRGQPGPLQGILSLYLRFC